MTCRIGVLFGGQRDKSGGDKRAVVAAEEGAAVGQAHASRLRGGAVAMRPPAESGRGHLADGGERALRTERLRRVPQLRGPELQHAAQRLRVRPQHGLHLRGLPHRQAVHRRMELLPAPVLEVSISQHFFRVFLKNHQFVTQTLRFFLQFLLNHRSDFL